MFLSSVLRESDKLLIVVDGLFLLKLCSLFRFHGKSLSHALRVMLFMKVTDEAISLHNTQGVSVINLKVNLLTKKGRYNEI